MTEDRGKVQASPSFRLDFTRAVLFLPIRWAYECNNSNEGLTKRISSCRSSQSIPRKGQPTPFAMRAHASVTNGSLPLVAPKLSALKVLPNSIPYREEYLSVRAS